MSVIHLGLLYSYKILSNVTVRNTATTTSLRIFPHQT